MPMAFSNSHWKHQETKGLLMFSGGIERGIIASTGLQIYSKTNKTLTTNCHKTLNKYMENFIKLDCCC